MFWFYSYRFFFQICCSFVHHIIIWIHDHLINDRPCNGLEEAAFTNASGWSLLVISMSRTSNASVQINAEQFTFTQLIFHVTSGRSQLLYIHKYVLNMWIDDSLMNEIRVTKKPLHCSLSCHFMSPLAAFNSSTTPRDDEGWEVGGVGATTASCIPLQGQTLRFGPTLLIGPTLVH